MFFKKEIKISHQFGFDYVKRIIELLGEYFLISYNGIENIEIDFIFYNFIINDKKITFLSEGMSGTKIIGNRKLVNKIIETGLKEDSDLFELCN